MTKSGFLGEPESSARNGRSSSERWDLKSGRLGSPERGRRRPPPPPRAPPRASPRELGFGRLGPDGWATRSRTSPGRRGPCQRAAPLVGRPQTPQPRVPPGKLLWSQRPKAPTEASAHLTWGWEGAAGLAKSPQRRPLL